MTELVVDNPYTLEPAVRIELASQDEVGRTLDRATQAAKAWRKSSLSDRKNLCLRVIELMERDAKVIVEDITRMMGKPLRQAVSEVAGMGKRARHMVNIAEIALADDVLPTLEGLERRIVREPLGVVFNLPAWNYPLLTAVNVVVPAVLCGNAVVLKHSPRSPLCGEHFARAFKEAGAPADLVQALHCDHATSEKIAGDPRVNFVAFTGSVLGGRRIYAAAATQHFVDVGLELGGKDPAYVAADADPEKAADSLVDGACYNAGQSCCGIERVYVHESLYSKFIERAVEQLRAYQLGDPTKESTTLGPLAQPNQPAFLEAQVRQAKSAGARVLLGGASRKIEGRGRFFEPTLLVDVNPDLDVVRIESFGPVLPVMSVRSDEEALALMNDSDLGLTAAIYTRDRDRASRLARDLETGTVYMNQCDTLDPGLPWTGTKNTGKGSSLSRLGFLHLTRPKSLNFKL